MDEEDIRFTRIFEEKFACVADIRCTVGLSCRALERSAPIKGVWSDAAQTLVSPWAVNAAKARSIVEANRRRR